MLNVLVNGHPLQMELDMGAAVSIVSVETLRKLLPNAVLQPCHQALRTYTGQPVADLGN